MEREEEVISLKDWLKTQLKKEISQSFRSYQDFIIALWLILIGFSMFPVAMAICKLIGVSFLFSLVIIPLFILDIFVLTYFIHKINGTLGGTEP